jgi:hypothetical protein
MTKIAAQQVVGENTPKFAVGGDFFSKTPQGLDLAGLVRWGGIAIFVCFFFFGDNTCGLFCEQIQKKVAFLRLSLIADWAWHAKPLRGYILILLCNFNPALISEMSAVLPFSMNDIADTIRM